MDKSHPEEEVGGPARTKPFGDVERARAQMEALERSRIRGKQAGDAGREQHALAEALGDIAAALNSTLNLEEVLERILTNVGRVVPHDAANIMLIESGIARVIVRGRGYTEYGVSQDETLELRFSVADVSNLSRMVETRQPIVISDTRNHPGWALSPEAFWVRSYAGAPICLGKEVIGFINLDSATPDFFTLDHAERLLAFTDQAAIAIRNARLYESERRQRQITETLLEASEAIASLDLSQVLLTLAGRLLDVSGFHICAISEWDRETGQIRPLAERARAIWPPDGGERYRLSDYPTTELVLTTGEPALVHTGMDKPEVTWMREMGLASLLMLPLRAGREMVGLVEIGSTNEEFGLDQTTVQRCRQILQETAARLTSPLRANSDAALLALAVRLVGASGGSSCSISAWHRLEREVRTAVEYGDLIWPPGEGLAYGLDEYPSSAYALEKGTSIAVRSGGSTPYTADRDGLAKWGARTLVAQPLSVKGEPIGLVELYDVVEERVVEDDELRLWRAVADQAAVAIKNAQLYQAERRGRALAQTLQKTAEALASSVHVGDTLNLIVDQLGEVLQYDRAVMMLVEEEKLHVVAARGSSDRDQVLEETYHYPDIPLFRESMATGKPLVLSDARKNPRWTRLPGLEASTRGWIGVPLAARDAVTGFLSIGSNRLGAYTARDVKAVTAFAQQAAVAIESARLLTELETSLSDLRKAQAHLARTARLHAAGEIATGVAHQINNPLTAVIAESHLLLQGLAPDSPGYASAMAIQRAARRAGTVAQRLLDFARTSPLVMQPLDINLSVQGAVSLVSAQIEPHVAQLVVELAPGLPMIEASEEHLGDVWINLLINARDAVGDSGKGVIKVTTGLSAEGDAIEVTVQDNGSGIAAEHLERIFDPFFTTKDHGTGLGLSLCHDVVTQHGGSIKVESKAGQGATFTVILPLSKAN